MADKVWVEIRDPNCLPDLKGPFPRSMVTGFLREAMEGRPRSYLTVLSVTEDGALSADDGPEYLMIADGRSRGVALRHIERLRQPVENPKT